MLDLDKKKNGVPAVASIPPREKPLITPETVIEKSEAPQPLMSQTESAGVSAPTASVVQMETATPVVTIKGKSGKRGSSKESSKDYDTLCQNFAERFTISSEVKMIDSGSIGFNYIFGGGIPRGRIIELHSDSGLGKTTCVLCWCLKVCQMGGVALYLDAEKALNESLIFGVGLEPYYKKSFTVLKVGTFAHTEDIMDSYLNCNRIPDIIVVDSVTSLLSEKIVSGELKIEEVEPGWHSRMSSSFLMKYKDAVARAGSSLVIVNQKRTKINFFGPSVVKAAGGVALEFYPDIRVDMSLASWIEEESGGVKRKIGADITAECPKNKVTMPFVKTIISVFFGRGISNIRAFTFLLQEEGAMTQNKSYYYIDMNGMKETCQGRRQVEEWVIKNEIAVIDFLKSKERL